MQLTAILYGLIKMLEENCSVSVLGKTGKLRYVLRASYLTEMLIVTEAYSAARAQHLLALRDEGL